MKTMLYDGRNNTLYVNKATPEDVADAVKRHPGCKIVYNDKYKKDRETCKKELQSITR